MTKANNTLELLQQNWQLLSQSVETLELSVDKCSKIKTGATFSFEEQESIDSLTSKFSRTSDIFTQKVLRGVWAMLHEPYEPFIDFMNKAEKLNIIHSADELLRIRDLRNQIAHEYLPEAIGELMIDVIESYPSLKNNINKTHNYLQNRNWL
jgi:hypothetical protein